MSVAARPRFHLAFPVKDLDRTRQFYVGLLGCTEGRSTTGWVDFDFHGHQISAHLQPGECRLAKTNRIDGKNVPARHFGLILEWEDWAKLAERLRTGGVDFIIEPGIRFKGEVGEQATMFLLDPSGNALEFKSFRSENSIFAR
jgi:extradiol dioxygenase family protein